MPAVILASLAAVVLAAAPDEDNPTPPVRVLLVTGVDHPAHHWKETAPVLGQLISEAGRCVVRVSEDPDVLATDEIFKHDVILLHFRNEKPLATRKRRPGPISGGSWGRVAAWS